jgi:hypothetical protein
MTYPATQSPGFEDMRQRDSTKPADYVGGSFFARLAFRLPRRPRPVHVPLDPLLRMRHLGL